VYCVVVWQCVIGMVCVLCGGVASCYRYGVCTVALNTAHSTHTIHMTCCQYTHHTHDMLPVHTPYI